MKFNNRLYFAKKISNYYRRNIWIKFENLNLTGSHKDREALKLIKIAKKNNFKKIGCASTGNLAISLAFYSKLEGLESHIWLNNNQTTNLVKELGAKIYLKKFSLKKLYLESDKFFKKNKIFNANPGSSDEKLKANKNITLEILKENKNIQGIVASVNNGSHFLGLSSSSKKTKFIGVISKSNLAKSINANSMVEIKNLKNNKPLRLIEANDVDILRGFKLLYKEGIFVEGSSCAIIGSLKKIKKIKNICCVLSGSAHKNLGEVQKIILRSNHFPLN